MADVSLLLTAPTPPRCPGSHSFSPSQGLCSNKYPISFLHHQFLPLNWIIPISIQNAIVPLILKKKEENSFKQHIDAVVILLKVECTLQS